MEEALAAAAPVRDQRPGYSGKGATTIMLHLVKKFAECQTATVLRAPLALK